MRRWITKPSIDLPDTLCEPPEKRLWERACPQWGQYSQHRRCLTHRHREQTNCYGLAMIAVNNADSIIPASHACNGR